MIPRRQSIFHLAEEGDARCHQRRSLVGGASRGAREGLVVGLQIIVHDDDQHQHRRQQHGRDARAASIVLKQMVKAPAPAASSRHAVPCSFLKACSLCRMELSPLKDVYMYRGDQGFCSEECRRQQIVVDEAQERRWLQTHHHRGAPSSPHAHPRHAGEDAADRSLASMYATVCRGQVNKLIEVSVCM